jgi:serine/threonine protein kinase
MAKLHRLMPDTEFARAFVVDRVIGEGAMGTVYLAHRKGDGSSCALKVLKPSIAEDERATTRFAREAIVGERIASEHVVNVLDAGFDEETGLYWMSMEYLDGLALADHLAQRNPDPNTRRALLRHLFDAIAAAHRAGVLHRDLKPENVMVTESDILKVLDFGVAKTFAPHMAASATEGGLGTPMWTAPEQGKGGSHHRPTVDVWALGLLTFFILTGQIYWKQANDERASMLDLAQEMLRAPIVTPSERARELGNTAWPETLDAWFLRCVNRDADARFPDADHARAALFPQLGFEAPPPLTAEAGSLAPPASAELVKSPSKSRTLGLVHIAVAVALAVLILGAGALYIL